VPADLIWMPGPGSYTSEDLAELHTFGSPLLLSAICEALSTQGARLASPGEFTRRAFLNGRIDLTRAEAVRALIHAQDEAEHRRAFEHLAGAVHQRILGAKRTLTRVCAFCEAGIDFSDQDLEVVEPAWVESEIAAALQNVRDLLAPSGDTRVVAEGIRVLIVGKPNVGKSTLLNCLSGQERALVTEIPGTTRDIVEGRLEHRGLTFALRDSAGLRDSRDWVEAEGIGRARDALRSADLIVFVVDGSRPVSSEDLEIADEITSRNVLPVINKSDLPQVARVEELPSQITAAAPLLMSAKTGAGRELLLDRMVERVEGAAAGPQAHSFQVNARQRDCLMRAAESLERALGVSGSEDGLELLAVDLRDALGHLGEVVGETVTDDLLHLIFSEFCIGK